MRTVVYVKGASGEECVGVPMFGEKFEDVEGTPVRLLKVDGKLGPYVGAVVTDKEGVLFFYYADGSLRPEEAFALEEDGVPCRVGEEKPKEESGETRTPGWLEG